MITCTLNLDTNQVILSGKSENLPLLEKIQDQIRFANKRLKSNYKPAILKETIESIALKNGYHELILQCKDRDGAAEVISILKNNFKDIQYVQYTKTNTSHFDLPKKPDIKIQPQDEKSTPNAISNKFK